MKVSIAKAKETLSGLNARQANMGIGEIRQMSMNQDDGRRSE